uniref:DNA-binding protein n=1 Tax=Desulfobacca acetoxidans TaxID=60893 RepID=A0A7C3Z1X3_9BACT
MKRLAIVGVLLTTSLILAGASYGQRTGDVWSTKGGYSWLFNPETVETLSGEVVAVGKFTPIGKPAGIRFTLKTDQGPIEVLLGRGSYVEQQDLKFKPQDKVTVKGSRIDVEGNPTIIAAEVTKGDKTLKLRDANGAPLWNRQSNCTVNY